MSDDKTALVTTCTRCGAFEAHATEIEAYLYSEKHGPGRCRERVVVGTPRQGQTHRPEPHNLSTGDPE